MPVKKPTKYKIINDVKYTLFNPGDPGLELENVCELMEDVLPEFQNVWIDHWNKKFVVYFAGRLEIEKKPGRKKKLPEIKSKWVLKKVNGK